MFLQIKTPSRYLLIASLLIGNAALADAPVWKVSKGDDAVYLGGTFHILTQADHPMPGAFLEAYELSDTVVFEVDIAEAQAPESEQKFVRLGSYPGGKTIKDFVKPKTFRKLEKHCAVRGIPLQSLPNFRAGTLAVTLTVIEMQRLGLVGVGVDEFFYLLALNARKPMVFLETIDEQIEFLAAMGDGYEDELMEETLRDMERIDETLPDYKKAWRNADLQWIEDNDLTPMREDYPKAYAGLLVDRNHHWLPRLEGLFDNDATELVLVGVAHMVGADGVLHLLEQKGYRVEQLD